MGRSRSNYEALAYIAAGGMGTVHIGRARDGAGSTDFVALKCAHAHLLGDPAFRRMFLAEGRLASRIGHPNVVAALDLEEVDDTLTLVMEYVEGGSLAELIFSKEALAAPLSPHAAIRIVLDATAGADAVHALEDDDGRPLRVVHRDISPHNILVGIDGVARLTDLGIAKPGLSTAGATASNALRGKFAYMSPEHVHGEALDARSDVFGLGVTAWEALTRRHLFRAHSEIETVKRLLTITPVPPSRYEPSVPREVDDAVMRALEKSRDARWPSARAFHDALLSASDGWVATPEDVAAEVDGILGLKIDERRRLAAERARESDDEALQASDPVMRTSTYVTEPLSSLAAGSLRGGYLRAAASAPDRRVWAAAIATALLIAVAASALRPSRSSTVASAGAAGGAASQVVRVTPEANPPTVPQPSLEIETPLPVQVAAPTKAPSAPSHKQIHHPHLTTDKAPPNPYDR